MSAKEKIITLGPEYVVCSLGPVERGWPHRQYFVDGAMTSTDRSRARRFDDLDAASDFVELCRQMWPRARWVIAALGPDHSLAHQEIEAKRAELVSMTCQRNALAEALQKIASGDFPGAAAFMLNGEYNAMITKLQRIASDALATIPLQPIQQETDP